MTIRTSSMTTRTTRRTYRWSLEPKRHLESSQRHIEPPHQPQEPLNEPLNVFNGSLEPPEQPIEPQEISYRAPRTCRYTYRNPKNLLKNLWKLLINPSNVLHGDLELLKDLKVLEIIHSQVSNGSKTQRELSKVLVHHDIEVFCSVLVCDGLFRLSPADRKFPGAGEEDADGSGTNQT